MFVLLFHCSSMSTYARWTYLTIAIMLGIFCSVSHMTQLFKNSKVTFLKNAPQDFHTILSLVGLFQWSQLSHLLVEFTEMCKQVQTQQSISLINCVTCQEMFRLYRLGSESRNIIDGSDLSYFCARYLAFPFENACGNFTLQV